MEDASAEQVGRSGPGCVDWLLDEMSHLIDEGRILFGYHALVVNKFLHVQTYTKIYVGWIHVFVVYSLERDGDGID